MNQQIIQDFWNLPGVLGIALIHEEEEPYFYVKKRIADWEKQALIKMISPSIAKASKRLDYFELQVMGYHAYAYRLNHNFTLVVLTPNEIAAVKLMAANQLKCALQEDLKTATTMFELLTKEIHKTKAVLTTKTARTDATKNSYNACLEVKISIEELLNALNHLSKFTSNYMGSKLTANYWQLTRPNCKWLENFQINHSAKIAFAGAIVEPVSAVQHLWVKEWTAAFIKRCSQIVQDLPNMIEQKGLDEQQKRLLLTPPASELTKLGGGTAT